ncbi:MAG: PilZ domain-containing protein [Lachnospiraceae bacterium]|nr:PilZ domain-containing protein [Lachnospiraceae bacterium]
MRIEELMPNTPITLMVNIDGQKLTFESKISEVYPRRHLVLADIIYHNDKIVTFRAKNIIIDVLINTGNEKPEIFKNVTVTLVKKKDGSLCYNLATIAESKTYNRRQNFRCYVGISTSFQCGPNKAAHLGVIRDVSVNGFSIVCDEKLPLEQNQIVHVVLKDYIEETNEKFVFHLYGLIARTQELDNKSILYGCRLNNYLPALEAYIMKKERLRLKRTSGGDL